MYQLYQGDCLEIMRDIPDNSIDMVLCDPPYGINFQKYFQIAKERIEEAEQAIASGLSEA